MRLTRLAPLAAGALLAALVAPTGSAAADPAADPPTGSAAADPAADAGVTNGAGAPHTDGGPTGATADRTPGDRAIARAARVHDLPEAAVRGMLRRDEALRLAGSGRLYYVDGAPDDRHQPAPRTAASAATTSTTAAAAAAPYPTSQTFHLHSRPGAQRTIYLDFDGHTVRGTWWNHEQGVPARTYPGLDADGVSGFSSGEHAIVQEVWRRVAEDFAPYDVDVTTADPGLAALTRSGSSDQHYGMRALVTDSTVPAEVMCDGRCVGVAALDVFDAVPYAGESAGYLQPAWIFSTIARDDPAQIAETVTHEVGHTLALVHDGDAEADYHLGNGFWSPVMGYSYGALTQFSKGEYDGAVNAGGGLQDDFRVMDASGLDFRADDHGDRTAPTAISTLATGVIERAADTDWFEVSQACTGPLSVRVTPATVGPNLDVQLTVVDADTGATLATLDPAADNPHDFFTATGLDATWRLASPASGRWLVGVDGTGQGDPLTGYSDYGSVGQYSVHVSTDCPAPAAPTAPTTLDARTTASSLTVSWRPPVSPGGTITAYVVAAAGRTTVLDPDARSHTVTGLAPGTTHRVSVAARNAIGESPAALGWFTTSTTKPGRPGIREAVPGALGGKLTARARWTAPASTGGTAITGYRVVAVRMAKGGSVLSRRAFRAGADRRSLTMRLDRGYYRFQVRAENAVGAGAASALSNRVRAR